MARMSKLGIPDSQQREGLATTTTGCLFIYFWRVNCYTMDFLARWHLISICVVSMMERMSFDSGARTSSFFIEAPISENWTEGGRLKVWNAADA